MFIVIFASSVCPPNAQKSAIPSSQNRRLANSSTSIALDVDQLRQIASPAPHPSPHKSMHLTNALASNPRNEDHLIGFTPLINRILDGMGSTDTRTPLPQARCFATKLFNRSSGDLYSGRRHIITFSLALLAYLVRRSYSSKHST